MIYGKQKGSLDLWQKNENNYKFTYTQSTSFKSLTSINCRQNKYLKKPKIKLLNCGEENRTEGEGNTRRKWRKDGKQQPPDMFLPTEILMRGTDTNPPRVATTEATEKWLKVSHKSKVTTRIPESLQLFSPDIIYPSDLSGAAVFITLH